MPRPSPIIEATEQLLRTAVADGICPAVVCEVGDDRGPLWREAFGTLDGEPATEGTWFDLASITKALVTTSLFMNLAEERRLDLLEPVARSIPEWTSADRADVTLRDLLEHASGLPARLVDAPPDGRRAFEHEIATVPLEYAPRTKSIYSDLDFILLGFLIEDRGGAPLDEQFAALRARLVDAGAVSAEGRELSFRVKDLQVTHIAPTAPLPDDRRRGRMLAGEVHDHYAAALGGVAGHAGLFGTAAGVGAWARTILRGAKEDEAIPPPFSPRLVQRATRKTDVPGSSRALGWDTMLPTSSCGTELSPAAFGHVGFTGTSLWIDPILNRYFVLLTNRVAGRASSDDLQTVRRSFHNLVAKLESR